MSIHGSCGSGGKINFSRPRRRHFFFVNEKKPISMNQRACRGGRKNILDEGEHLPPSTDASVSRVILTQYWGPQTSNCCLTFNIYVKVTAAMNKFYSLDL